MIEYEEILSKHVGIELGTLILQIIENAPNTIFNTRYYNWNLIKNDPDDNKFVDCYIASNANYLVTHDKHFNHLKTLKFPYVEITNAQNFISLLKSF